MAELYQSAVDGAWNDPGDEDPRASSNANAPARPLASYPAPMLGRLAEAALPRPPAVLPEATSTFAPIFASGTRVAKRSRNDSTLIIRSRRDASTVRWQSRWWIGILAAMFAAASAVVVLQWNRTTSVAANSNELAVASTKPQPATKQFATPTRVDPTRSSTPTRPPKTSKRVATATKITKPAAKPKRAGATAKAAKPKRTASATTAKTTTKSAAKPAKSASKKQRLEKASSTNRMAGTPRTKRSRATTR